MLGTPVRVISALSATFPFVIVTVVPLGTKFVVAGHLYPITKDQKKLNKFAEKVNSHNADYVLSLIHI